MHRICMKSKRIEKHKSKNIVTTDLSVSFNECDRRANDENVKFGVPIDENALKVAEFPKLALIHGKLLSLLI